ncbi:phosphate ABC transporter permease subunit PstC [Anoxybacillus rupiensis]|uniref:Phosphate transport system permease protein n=1 Tax=Anoxybacteroides rupiense TaxID=311460 RepID=A0ABD5IRE6_9BACL|nr:MULTISPECIES: phosphate ABC transporter permease subunit PstC [Anoxybacillus]KXG11295.1 Phosphate transport system permease protein PstC [Anoxybacillus sp. P3H1B]MBB3906873.1 phosphate transport system permease protein [Anoxybacillus rupiensis]MBS2770018.1 phosphate ABC transporter permease subunit PstC [Anoxybacillus rupiensis]MDE8562609.1 phosphate ABC transporter permease subunit PstC [Anoxybacillus rupiensis]MED5050855.1 phosphate ABC transporter permease subunit PstC [Anoxybacillus rup
MKGKKPINYWKSEYIGRSLVTVCGFFIVLVTLAIIIFICSKGIQSFTQSHIPLGEMLFSKQWAPNQSEPKYGAVIFIVGSTLVSVGAVVLSTPIALALAVFINYISPWFGTRVLKPVLELLVGIPSVVYGFLGVTILVPLFREWWGGVGFSLIAGMIVLSIMILPTIASIASDAIGAVPRAYLEASYGLGSTRWQAISRVIVPAARKGILTGIVLGLARAFGEALAVQMVIGNTVKLPSGLYSPTATLTGILTMDMSNTLNGTAWNNALWTLAMILLLISFLFILLIRAIGQRGEK